jgi:hypothetical protein
MCLAQTLASYIPWALDARRKRCSHPDLTKGETTPQATVLALHLLPLGRSEVVMGSPAPIHHRVELTALCVLTAGSNQPRERGGGRHQRATGC